jgi:hypothetical protein
MKKGLIVAFLALGAIGCILFAITALLILGLGGMFLIPAS